MRSVHGLLILLGLILATPGRADDRTLNLLGGRFEVEAHYRTATTEGEGHAAALSSNSGFFWFFGPENVEILVKVLDGCSLSQRFWVFAAGMTNVEVTLSVTDTWAHQTRTYTNPLGRAFVPIQDTSAFSTCDAPQACGQGTLAEITATPRPDQNAEWLALTLGGGLTAPEALYQRLVSDLAAIRAANPATQSIPFTPKYHPSSLIFMMAEEAFGRFKNGQYHEWDCLNRWYSVRQTEPLDIIKGGALHFNGVFEMKRVMGDYAALPGITVVELNSFALPPMYVPARLCAWPDGTAIHYFFDQGTAGPGFWEYITDAPGAAPRQVTPDAALFEDCVEKYSVNM